MNTTIQQRVMHYAHIIYQAGWCDWSTAVTSAWTLHYLREYLKRGVVRFTYLKQDGTWREARGTLNTDIIPPSKAPTGRQQAMIDAGLELPNYKSIAYYDLDKEAWRAFNVDCFSHATGVAVLTNVMYNAL